MSITAQEIQNYIATEQDLELEELAPDALLFSSGILDSFAMIDLVSFLESKTGIRVRPTEITLENFDSIDRILAFIEAH